MDYPKKSLEQISDHVLMTEFDRAIEIINEIVGANNSSKKA